MDTDLLQAAKQWMVQSRYDHAIGLLIDYLESQAAPQETTTITGVDWTICHRCMHPKHDHTDQGCRICHLCDPETTTDAPACEHIPSMDKWPEVGTQDYCRLCQEPLVLRWVPAGSA